MIGQACRYDRQQHRILHPRMEKYILRQAPANIRGSLFVYYHNLHRTFVIAQWVVPDKAFVDVMNLGHSLANFGSEEARQFRLQIKSPVGNQQLAKALRQKELDRLTERQATNDQQVELNNRRCSTKLSLSLAGT